MIPSNVYIFSALFTYSFISVANTNMEIWRLENLRSLFILLFIFSFLFKKESIKNLE
jgi:hypothetical protein